MKKVYGLGALALVLVLSLVGMNLQGTFAQGGGENLPTPTPHPVENVAYELTTVGGTDETLTFAGLEKDGFTVGETTVESNYPRGMVFTVNAESANGEVTDVTLFMTFAHGSGNRFAATYDEETGAWVAKPWVGGEGQPAWTHFDFTWRFRDETGVTVDTEPITSDYWDPTRQWYRVESDYVILYWFGFEEITPEYVAENAAFAVAATEQRRIEGFGGPLSYKPVGVVYPTREALGEISGSGVSSSNAAGYTSDELGMTVQHISLPEPEWWERQQNCIYLVPMEDRTEQWRVDFMIFTVVPHEIAHLYQYDKGVSVGPNWWVEGQADYFAYEAGSYDARLRHLATLQDVRSLRDNIGTDVFEADGCYALAYDMGVSFINWLLSTYGGLETQAQITELLGRNVILADALEQVTGKSFFDLENEWRVYLGYAPLTLADIDPASAMAEPVDALYVVGDTVVFPGPAPIPLTKNPGVNQAAVSTCFAGIEAKILRVGNLDGINYYEIDCQGLTGWLTESKMPIP